MEVAQRDLHYIHNISTQACVSDVSEEPDVSTFRVTLLRIRVQRFLSKHQ
jgi:hypothetical protein